MIYEKHELEILARVPLKRIFYMDVIKVFCNVLSMFVLPHVTTCGAPDALTCLGARTFQLSSHLLESYNKYQ